ncbi:Acetolactate synthase, mitochondrial [Sorochytrium milnesiophthora]
MSAVDTATEYDASMVGMTGGEIVHEMLRRLGVRNVWGYPGGAILPVYDAIHESKHFNFFLPRHEQALQDALMDGTPLVVLCGQVVTSAIGTDAFQEADIIGISRSCTKWNVMVKDINDLPRRLAEAFEIATSGRPGPVLVDLPKDVTASKLRRPTPKQDLEKPRIPGRPLHFLSSHALQPVPGSTQLVPNRNLQRTLNRVADAVNNAKQPVIYAGQGILSSPNGPRLLRELSHKAQIPVTTTLQALGSFDEHDPLSLHMLGMHGSAYANFAIQEADVILALGARFDDRVTGNLAKFAPGARAAEREPGNTGGIFQFEIMPKNINKTVAVTEAVEGDLTDNLSHFLPLVNDIRSNVNIDKCAIDTSAVALPPRQAWLNRVQQWKQQHPFTYPVHTPSKPMKPQHVVATLNRMADTLNLKSDLVITTGVGQHQMWAAQFYRWRTPRSCITSGGLGTMGYGLPAAIGAQIALMNKPNPFSRAAVTATIAPPAVNPALPHKLVVDIDGDASFMMTAMELMTAAEFRIPVKVLILNNDFQGMVKQWQDLFYDERYSATRMVNPDFVKMAEAFGVRALRADCPESLEVAMTEFLTNHDGPVLLEARVCKQEHVYPMVPAGKALHEMVLGPPQKASPAPASESCSVER